MAHGLQFAVQVLILDGRHSILKGGGLSATASRRLRDGNPQSEAASVPSDAATTGATETPTSKADGSKRAARIAILAMTVEAVIYT